MAVSRRAGLDAGTSSALTELDNRPIWRMGPPTPITSTSGVTATAGVGDWGSWVEVTPLTAVEYGGLFVLANSASSATDTTTMISVGIGGSGSEVQIAAFNASSHGSGTSTGATPGVYLPVRIPKGSRLAVRGGAAAATVHVSYFPAAVGLPTRLESISGNAAAYTPKVVAASSAWTQMTASTNSAYRGLILIPGAGAATIDTNTDVTVTLGIGASGAEVEIGTCRVNTTTAESLSLRIGTTCDVIVRHIPKGTRIAVKQSSARTYFNATVIGIPY